MREKVPLVNEKDEIIGVRYRDELLPTDIHRIVAIWVTNSKGDVLLARRALHKKLHHGLWGPAAAGAVSYGESYDEAAKKELAEEIGLTGVSLKLVAKQVYQIENEKRAIAWYRTICEKPESYFKLEDDVAEVKWFTKDHLLELLSSKSSQFVPSHVFWGELFLS